MRVLIVEDNRRLAESIRDILKHWYDCDICGDGNTGYFLLTDGGYDAAVLDLMLPGMDGMPEPGQHIAEPGGLYVKWAGKKHPAG